MEKEIVDYIDLPLAEETYRGFQIISFGSSWMERITDSGDRITNNKKFYYNSKILDFAGIKEFVLNDDEGEPIRSIKNGINAGKKIITNSINTSLNHRERISNFDWGKYLDWYKKSVKSEINETQLKEYCISLHKKDLNFSDLVLSKVPADDEIWTNYIKPIPWFEK